MREAIKWTTGYQVLNILLTNLKAVAISFVFIAAAFYGFMAKPVFREILSVIFITVYFGIVYSRAHRFAVFDKKEYTGTKPSMLKGVMFGVCAALTFAVVLAIYRIMWLTVGSDGTITSVPAWIYSIFFLFYTIPYNGIMGLAHGQMTWYSELLMIIVPIAATAAGYASGLAGFNLMDKFGGMIYEKKKE